MVLFLVLLTLVVCLGIDLIRTRKAKLSAEPQANRDKGPAVAVALESLFHPGHTWARIEDMRSVMVGIDDFAQRFMGNLDSVSVAASGVVVQQGERLATLRHKGRELAIAAPVSGVLIETNPDILKHPGIVNASPYQQGWLAKIRPSRLETEIRNLLRGVAADRWREGLQAQMASWLAPEVGMVLQDGGEWVDNLSDILTDERWQELARTLFPALAPDQSNKPVKGMRP
jgi:glycine cleavage system H protein